MKMLFRTNPITNSILALVLILSSFFLLVDCKQADSLPEGTTSQLVGDEQMSLVDSHLHFTNNSSLESYLEELEGRGAAPIRSRLPKGFVSLADRDEYVINRTRAEDDCADTEMTREEFAISRAEDLLVEPRLYYIMDTSLVIGVGNRTYKVCEEGTFSYEGAVSNDRMSEIIGGIDRNELRSLSKGTIVAFDNGLEFIRTFGENCDDSEFNIIPPEPETRGLGLELERDLHYGYNVTTYNWNANSIVQNILEFFQIKDYIRYVELDSSHRLAVEMYNNNFGFIEAAGIKAVVQEKKRFLFVTYWVASKNKYQYTAGFNNLYSRHRNFMQAGQFTSFSPSTLSGYNGYNASIAGIGTVGFIYGDCSGVPYISDWASKITLCIPRLTMNGISISEETYSILQELYDSPKPIELFNVLKAVEARNGASNSPVVMLLPKPSNSMQFKNDLTMASGINTKTAKEYHIRLLLKGGFSWTGGVPAPIQFSMYEIMGIDAFASVKYNNKWTGIRFCFEID